MVAEKPNYPATSMKKYKIIEIDPSLKITDFKYTNKVSIKDALGKISKAKNIEACNDDELLIDLPAQHGLLSAV